MGPRGNARFLEVDGLRVKYIGKVFGKERERRRRGIKNVATLADVFFSPSPVFARRCVAFFCLGMLFCDVLKKRNDLLLSAT